MEREYDPDLLANIDRLITDYLEAGKADEPFIIMGDQVDLEEMLEHGAYEHSDPRSAPSRALLTIAHELTAQDGATGLSQVLSAYRLAYGAKRAAILNVRWHYLAE